MTSKAASALVAAVGLAFAGIGAAHHSVRAIFDADDSIEVTGTVTSVEWMNPHIWFYVDVENEEGETVNWGFEMNSPNDLMRDGWRHDSLNVGEVITVVGSRARNGGSTAAVQEVWRPTGEQLFIPRDQ